MRVFKASDFWYWPGLQHLLVGGFLLSLQTLLLLFFAVDLLLFDLFLLILFQLSTPE
jgi:hypothetical protein